MRADTPPLIKEAQTEMIKVLSTAKNYEEFVGKIPESLRILKRYVDKLLSGNVSPEEYAHNVFQAIAAKQLKAAGFEVYPGQTIQYIITDEQNQDPKERVKAAQLSGAKLKFAKRKYLEMLFEAGETLIGISGYNLKKNRDLLMYEEKQLVLN